MLLLGSYRKLVDDALAELAARGHPDARPAHYFAMTAIAAGADSASELGRRLSVSKQAAAKTITVLLEHGYISRDADPRDPRRMRIEVPPPGAEMTALRRAELGDLRPVARLGSTAGGGRIRGQESAARGCRLCRVTSVGAGGSGEVGSRRSARRSRRSAHQARVKS